MSTHKIQKLENEAIIIVAPLGRPWSCVPPADTLLPTQTAVKYTQYQHNLGIREMVLKSDTPGLKYLTAPPVMSSATMDKSLNIPELHLLICTMEMTVVPTSGTYIHKALCLEQRKQSKCVSNNYYFFSL